MVQKHIEVTDYENKALKALMEKGGYRKEAHLIRDLIMNTIPIKQGISVHCINTMPQIPLVGVFPNPPEKNNTKCSCRCSIGTMNKKFTLNCVK